MGYLYLSLALFGGIAKGFCGKRVSGDMQTFQDCLFINVLRMLFCAAIGLFLVFVQNDEYALRLTPQVIGIYLLSATGMTAFCVCWMYAYKQDAYVFLNIFTMLGSIVTCFLSFAFYQEEITWNEWLGMAIILCAVVIMSKYNKELKGRVSWLSVLILLVGCAGSAIADFSQKSYMRNVGESAACFNFYTYAVSVVLVSLLWGATCLKKERQPLTAAVTSSRNVFAYFAMSVFLFMNTTFKTLAAGLLTSAQIYPVLQGANLILSGLMAHFLFKERANAKSVVGMCCAFVGLMIMNIL